MAPATIGPSPTQCLGGFWRPKIGYKGNISEWISAASPNSRTINFQSKTLILIISFPKRLGATSTRKIHTQMKIFLRPGCAFGGDFGRPNGSKTLRRRWVNGGLSHFGSPKLVILDHSLPKRLRAISTRKIRIQMQISLPSGSTKWPPKALPEGRKIFIWIRIL